MKYLFKIKKYYQENIFFTTDKIFSKEYIFCQMITYLGSLLVIYVIGIFYILLPLLYMLNLILDKDKCNKLFYKWYYILLISLVLWITCISLYLILNKL